MSETPSKEAALAPIEKWLSRQDMVDVLQIAARKINQGTIEDEKLGFELDRSHLEKLLIHAREQRLKNYVTQYEKRNAKFHSEKTRREDEKMPSRKYEPETAARIVEGIINLLVIAKGNPAASTVHKISLEKAVEQASDEERARINKQRVAWLSESLLMIYNLQLKRRDV